MAEFTAITTQEEFDARLGERLRREREKVTKEVEEQYKGFVSKEDHEKAVNDLNGKLQAKTDEVNVLNVKVRTYENDSVKTRVAHEVGLPYGMASRLSGEDEKAIRADAESLVKLMGIGKGGAPAAITEPLGSGGEKAAYQALLNTMKQE